MSNSFTEEQHRLQCLAAASNLSEVGNMLESRGELQMAEKLYQRAWEINEKNAGPKASSTGVHLIQLARICLLQNKFSDAEARYRKAMSMYVMNPEETDAELASALEGYAWVLSTKRLSKQAEQVYEQARAARKRIDYSGF